MIGKHAIILSLLLMLTVLAGCVPAATTGEPGPQLPTASEIVEPSTPTFAQTAPPTSTALPTGTLTSTPTMTVEPSETQPFIVLPGVTVQPKRTHTTRRQVTPTATIPPTATQTLTATIEPTVTETISPSATLCPVTTPEPFWVEPVTSPTDQFSQTVQVYVGNGEEVTIVTESGTFTATGNFNYFVGPALVEVTLLPNTVHHLEVTAKIRTVLSNGCMYGGYTLATTTDGQGAPLTIVQGTPVP